MMTLGQIAGLGKELAKFLALFVGLFRSQPGFALGRIYVQGLLSDLGRKNVEAIAMVFNKPPRTLQRFLESVKWDESGVSDRIRNVRISATLEMSAPCYLFWKSRSYLPSQGEALARAGPKARLSPGRCRYALNSGGSGGQSPPGGGGAGEGLNFFILPSVC
jgi:hypothetical protein